jgi:hypothetical protein
VSKFLDWLKAAGLNEERPIAGISPAEIGELAASQGQKELPAAYLEFLGDCGKCAGLFQRDAVFFFPEVKSLKSRVVEMMKDEGIEFSMPTNAFVFGAYQGFQFHYFICDRTADPAVYQIDDGGGGPELIADTFSSYIQKRIAQYHAAFYRKT